MMTSCSALPSNSLEIVRLSQFSIDNNSDNHNNEVSVGAQRPSVLAERCFVFRHDEMLLSWDIVYFILSFFLSTFSI